MDNYATTAGIIRTCIAVGNLFFIYARQSIRVVVVFVGIEFTQERRNVFKKIRVSRFPAKRHDDILIHERGICDDTGFLVVALIEWNGQRPYFLLHYLFVLGTTVIRFYPRFLHVVVVNQSRNGNGRYVRLFVSIFDVRNQSKQ